jgi:hypothetical protein
MKTFVLITAAILLAGLIGWAVYDPDDLLHKTIGYSDEEQKAAWDKVDKTQSEVLQSIEARKLEAGIRFVELKHGEAAASRYRMCHTYPPTTKQHQLECERLDKQFRRDEAEADKHPW